MRQKRDPSELTCTVCGQVCNCQSVLRDHMNTHTGERPYSCKQCHFTFGSIRSYRNHQRKVHGKTKSGEPTSYQCETCGKTYEVKKYFREHVKGHSAGEAPKKRYTCQFCGEVYHRFSILQAHQKPVGRMKDYKFRCRYCGIEVERLKCMETHEKRYHESPLSSSDGQMVPTEESDASLLDFVTTNPANPLLDEEDIQIPSTSRGLRSAFSRSAASSSTSTTQRFETIS